MGSKFFPVSVNLDGEKVLVLGAGKIALRKTKTLLAYGAKISVVTREVLEDEFLSLGVEIEKREFTEKDLEGVFMVVAATSDNEFNEKISTLCMERKILVNNITSKDQMNLRFASIYEGEDFQIGISSKSGNPKIAKRLREKLQEIFIKKSEK